MPNTNFQTFHQMGNAINDVVRQATGRDNVQNIDMDFVTVAQRTRWIENIVSGDTVTFETNMVSPLNYLITNIFPVQNLHGYDNSWLGGANGNILASEYTDYSSNGVTFKWGIDGRLTTNGTASANTRFAINGENGITLQAGTYKLYNTFHNDGTEISNARVELRTTISSINSRIAYKGYSNGYESFTVSETITVYPVIFIASGTNVSDYVFEPMLVSDSVTVTDYLPYSNVCPISGWTECNIYVSPTSDPDDPDKVTYEVEFPNEAGTVYGGTLTVNKDGSGTLTIDKVLIEVDGTEYFSDVTANNMFYIQSDAYEELSDTSNATDLCNMFVIAGEELQDGMINHEAESKNIYIKSSIFSGYTGEQLATYFTANNLQLTCDLIESETITLTAEQINTLVGENNIWTDTDNVTVSYNVKREVI